MNKMQEVFFYRVGVYDRGRILNKLMQNLNDDGWEVMNITFLDDQNVMMLANKVLPPPVFITMKDMTEEEMEEVRTTFFEAALNQKPMIVSGDVTLSHVDEPKSRTIEVTSEMLRRWREEDKQKLDTTEAV